MVFVPVPNTAQINLRYLIAEQIVENTLYFDRGLTEITPPALQSLADDLAAWAVSNLTVHLSDDITLQEVYATDLTDQNAPTATSTSGLPDAGNVNGMAAPNNVSICVSFRTAFRGRSFRGRNYVPGIPATQVSGNVVETAFRNAIQLGYEELLNPATYTDTEWAWSVVSRYENKAPRTVGVATPVTAVVFADSTVDSQRRRLPGRGR